ncbi:hypothetical protein EW146_g5455 [Bondarzewia mesenterica]|uniref:Uncharacterized protein n=1 Tax=Bondarzewia mesenterica TaxID=1095465 RepID=A0A4S4LS17_9AGAM|nr:hypothetical protein EW146_g5455 [Bondarzewia mesenterica]
MIRIICGAEARFDVSYYSIVLSTLPVIRDDRQVNATTARQHISPCPPFAHDRTSSTHVLISPRAIFPPNRPPHQSARSSRSSLLQLMGAGPYASALRASPAHRLSIPNGALRLILRTPSRYTVGLTLAIPVNAERSPVRYSRHWLWYLPPVFRIHIPQASDPKSRARPPDSCLSPDNIILNLGRLFPSSSSAHPVPAGYRPVRPSLSCSHHPIFVTKNLPTQSPHHLLESRLRLLSAKRPTQFIPSLDSPKFKPPMPSPPSFPFPSTFRTGRRSARTCNVTRRLALPPQRPSCVPINTKRAAALDVKPLASFKWRDNHLRVFFSNQYAAFTRSQKRDSSPTFNVQH